MALLEILTDDTRSDRLERIVPFLASHRIELTAFPLGDRVRDLAAKTTLDDAERAELLGMHPQLSTRFGARQGYRADVVCFHPAFPHLDVIVSKFGSVHYHFEHEHWYFIDGEAKFGFLGDDGTKFEITVGAGESLQVPEGCWQYFALTEKKRMKSMRFFWTEGRARPRVPVRIDHA